MNESRQIFNILHKLLATPLRGVFSIHALVLFGSILLIESLPYALLAEEFSAGQKVFKKCRACHTTNGKHRLGLTLKNIFGRSAGSANGYKKYSKDLRRAGKVGLVWNEASMTSYIT